MWDWRNQLGASASDYPAFDQVMSSPMVADLNNDKAPEIVFVTWNKNTSELEDMAQYFPINGALFPAACLWMEAITCILSMEAMAFSIRQVP